MWLCWPDFTDSPHAKGLNSGHPADRVREEAVQTVTGRVYTWPTIMSPAYENPWVLRRHNSQRQRESEDVPGT